MKSRYFFLPVGLCLLLAAAPELARAEDQCADVLNHGIFNTVTVNQSEGIKNDYNAWLCTTEFKTHQEAYNAGVSVGFPVYDIPLSLGSNFDSQQRDTWKKSHCSSTTDKSQYSATYQKVVSEISAVAVNAWRDCMITRYQTNIGLSSVALSKGSSQVQMKIKWQPYDSFDKTLPTVNGFSMVGAKLATVGTSLFKIGVKVPATETIMDFTRTAANQPVTLTLNTNRGSVTAFVPPQTMYLIVDAVLSPTVERRTFATKDYDFYQHTPGDDCVRDMNFSQTYLPPDGYTFISYTFEETTKAGKRTGYNSHVEGNGVRFNMHVQGDDGAFGFCESSGWLGLKVHVTGESWPRVPMTVWPSGSVKGDPLQETILLRYPYLTPGGDVRNLQIPFAATVRKVIGDDVITVQLTPGAASASGLIAKADPSGFLVIDGSQAFKDWRTSLAGAGPALSPAGGMAAPVRAASLVDAKAREACAKAGPNFEVYSVTGTQRFGTFSVVCGADPKAVASGAEPKRVEATIDLNQ